MKGLYFTIILVLMFSLLLMPLFALSGNPTTKENNENLRVFITETAEINNVSAKEYCINVAANNLNKNSHQEVIKAEIVAAYTKALYYKGLNKNTNYDLNDSTDGFISLDKIKEKYGDSFNDFYNKLCDCADKVFSKKILYNNAPILAERHTASSGITEDAKNLISGDFPYLISVESAGDLLYEKHTTEKSISRAEMNDKLQNLGLTPTEETADYFKDAESTKAGTVLKIKVLGKEFTGEEIKNAFSLPSACFTVSFKNNGFVFTTKGEGSFLGLSRTGAEYMAQNGSSYTQILSWYYPGCVLK